MSKTDIEFLYETLSCILRALQGIINNYYDEECFRVSMNKYINSTLKVIEEIQQQYEEKEK